MHRQNRHNLTECCKLTGFKFSVSKSEYIIFSRSKQIPETKLLLGTTELRRTTRLKLLGLTFDPKLTWKPHIHNIYTQCKKRLNILKVLAANNRGASKDVLINTYKAVIRSKLDYGATVYGSTAKSTLKQLDSIQTTALRIA
ncbi:GSCOCG00010925001-RA-CDS, partial [Cotesia congregata]